MNGDPRPVRANGGSRSAIAGAETGDAYVQRFTLAYEYPVHFTRDLFAPENALFAEVVARDERERRHRCLVVVDDGLAAARPGLVAEIGAYFDAHADSLELAGPPRIVLGGEACKGDLELVTRLASEIVAAGIDRHAFVVAVGGGAFLDYVGYVAAITHRGIRLIRVPTTVLSQNDSGVGVKNAVNAFGIKNLLGTFAPPFAVLNDAAFLDVLGERDRRAGMAEALKVALIRDRTFFAWFEANARALATFEPGALAHLIRRCAELHMIQIATSGDPFERGSARPLDYGHWSAHKLESLSRHELRHGEAVAIGIALDARYSVACGLLAAGQELRICALIRALGLPIWHPALEAVDASGDLAVLAGLREFREHLGGELTITLLASIGRGVEVHAMDEATIRLAIDWLGNVHRA